MDSYKAYEKQLFWNWCDKVVIAIFGVFSCAIWFYSGILQEAQRNYESVSATKYRMYTIIIVLIFTMFFLADFVIAKYFCKSLSTVRTILLIVVFVFSIFSFLEFDALADEMIFGKIVIGLHIVYLIESGILLLDTASKYMKQE